MYQKHFTFRKPFILMAVVVLFLVLSFAAMAEVTLTPGEELLKDADFSGSLKFGLYTESGGNAELLIDEGELLVDVSSIGRVSHAIQPYYDGFRLYQGVEYQLDFDARSTLTRDLFVRIQLNGGDYHAYFEQQVTVGEEMEHYSFTFVMKEASDPAPRLCINMGYTDSMSAAGSTPDDIVPHQVRFDNFSLVVKDASGLVNEDKSSGISPIRIDQIGYRVDAAKTAVFADLEGETFTVVKATNNDVVFEGTLSAAVEDPWSGATVRTADFSALTKQGAYKLVAADGTMSPGFVIGKTPYKKLLQGTLRMLYLQRCGSELDEAHAGIYAHPVCHSETAVIYGTDQLIDVSGGWHDAGDYGRYVVSGAKAAADLLLSYEMAPDLFDDAGIPESGDGVDDRLQEASYELDWMLKMQAENGGVYHKVTGENFPGFIKPQEETVQLVVSPISNTATGDFAGVLALASRIFAESGSFELSVLSEKYLAAAERAWAYLEDHEADPGFTNPPEIVTGEYPDGKAADERFWAAAELARTTGKDLYREAADALLASGGVTAEFGWVEMGGYGLYSLLTDPALGKDDESRIKAEDILRKAVQKAAAVIDSNPYGVNRTDSYEWGSNMGIANDGVMLMMGASLLGDESLKAAAARQLDYLLGENATGYCFVTGFGSKSPEHPHHRPSTAFGAAVPGMLVGGPDSALEDPFAQNVLEGCSPAACYADSDQSYSTNEVCVYWNSPLILLICALTGNGAA